MSRLSFAAATIAILAAALLLRLPHLGTRPFHGDEAVHAFKFRGLREHGVYRYDPNEYHGPTLYYAALPTVALSGHRRFADTTEADYRLATALFGAAMVLLVPLLADGIGRRAALWAMLLLAVSPAFVFYSRYFIQEILLAFFTLACIACGWRYRQTGKRTWLVAAGASAGLMLATKETAPLSFLAMAAGAVASSRLMARGGEYTRSPSSRRDLLLTLGFALLTALAVAYLFLSGLFSNPAGPLGYFRTYAPWLNRAGGTDIHRHPWWYYIKLLAWTHGDRSPAWTELFILALGVLGIILASRRTRVGAKRSDDSHSEEARPNHPNASPLHSARPDPGFIRFLAIYTVVLTLIYSVIPYKTPWCVLSFLSGFILLAGVASDWICYRKPTPLHPLPLSLAATLLAGCAHLAWQARLEASAEYANVNPYAYAQPSPDVENLGKMVNDLARVSPQGDATLVKVLATDPYYWPLPWYLRRMEHVGYFEGLPADPAAPIVIAGSDLDEQLTPKLPDHIMPHIYGLRPGVTFELFVRMDVWTAHVEELKRQRANQPAEGHR